MGGSIPGWLHLAWAIAGLTIALGGIVWVMFFFYPYLLWSKRVMSESLEMGRETSRILADVQHEIRPILADLREIVASVKEARDGGRIDAALRALEEIPQKLDRMASKNVLKSI